MKRCICVIGAMIIALAAVGRADALGVSVGAAAWYADWQMQEEGEAGTAWIRPCSTARSLH